MQLDRLRRRELLALIGGAAAVWPLTWPSALGAQQPPKLPTIGFLGSGTPAADAPWTTPFVQRLRELGWVEGRTVAIEYRWGEEIAERYAAIAAEFVRLKVDVIVTAGTVPIAAAKQATAAIPIVFAAAGDPIGAGLVTSLARPGGNATGLSVQQSDSAAKRLELLRELVPGLRRLAILIHVDNPASALDLHEVQAAASALGFQVVPAEVGHAEDIAPAIAAAKGHADALYVATGPLLNTHRVRIAALAIEARLPTMCGFRELVEAGGLASYGPSIPDLFRRAAEYVDKILHGAKPADIPVEQPTKFALTVNLATAKALGLPIPETFLVRADEVIE
jgi:putative tryptophan/tyrosine transport system substrate-binding protein